ncbi:FAD-dependent oxidoreductase [bacterium]|nr:FAD-dependent oxidoreductase [bacterium]MBU1064697.1 FAD-dependent oxidoreductase [bacterium]MBU1634092.1 FAD-dependent oxidoreductase [bacterium]MBU1872543.1 FAD-dependent oxidoreductase [bacterium]
MKSRFVIIGSSAAGMAAANAIRKQDSDSVIRIISKEFYPPYARIFLPKIITGEIALSDILIKSEEQICKLMIEVVFGKEVTNIDPGRKTLSLDDGTQLGYDKLLISTGASPKLPDIRGISLANVFGLRTLHDAEKISRQAKSSKRVVIIGGGLVSLKAAEALSNFDLDIDVIVRSPRILSQMLDNTSAELVYRAVKSHGVTVHFGCDVEEISGKTEVETVALSDGKNISCQMVIVGKGVTPNLSFLNGSGIRTDRGIPVDKYQRTNLSDIYAAGDIAQTPDFFKKGVSVKALWPNAVQQGNIAGLNMSGKKIENPEEINSNIVKLFGIDIASCGQIKGDDSCNEVVYQDNDVYRKLIFNKDVLIGAILAGNVDSIGILRSLILSKKKVFNIRNLLMNKSFRYTSILESVV